MPLPTGIKQINEFVWEFPKVVKQGVPMQVPARVFGSKSIIDQMDAQVYDQLTNVATLPGIINYAYCMPDGHSGYGFPIGGVAAMDLEKGVISPGGIGFDINCGMRLLTTNLTEKDVKPKLKELVNLLFQRVPAGVGSKGFVKFNKQTFREVLDHGAEWCVKEGYGWEEDLERTEEEGCAKGADNSKVSNKATERGMEQIGTLGSGNHYLEIQTVKPGHIFDKEAAKTFGIRQEGQIVVMFHCLPGDAKVLTEHGCWVNIRELENNKLKVKCFDPVTHRITDTAIEKFYKIPAKEKLFKIVTSSGREIAATKDHPFLTKSGLKTANEIKPEDKVAVMPFEGVEYEKPSEEIIVDEKDIRKIHNSDKIIEDLKYKGLLPLKMNSKQLPILTKLVGYITGDGNVRKNGRGWRVYIGGDKEDLVKIKDDLEELGFKTSKINHRTSEGEITSSTGNKLKVMGESHALECNSSAFTLLLIALGIPEGKKTVKKFNTPSWIVKAPKWLQRLYLAGYFGAELTKPILTKSARKYEYFERPASAVYKIESIKENAAEFLTQISQILRNFGIESKVTEERNAGRITKAGKTAKILLRISSDIENLLSFYSKINYEYCERKIIESNHVSQYLKSKQKLWAEKAECLKTTVKGVKFKPYQYNFVTPSFNEFINTKKFNPPTAAVWDEVKSVKQIENNEEFVYDIRVKSETHNFIADNFIVGNCGSRGLGHQIATDYLTIFLDVMQKKYGIKILDKELACAPFSSKEGQDYFAAMKCGLNMSFANRQVILHRIRECFEKIFGMPAEDMEMHQVYDVAHNTAKVERHDVNGKSMEVLVHRKGATRAFGPGRDEVPAMYRDIGQPIIIGGSMETGSYLLAGTEKAMTETFGSTCHGSGRTMSRTRAKQLFRGDRLQREMEQRGIYVKTTSFSGLAEEAGAAYKDIDEVIDSVHNAGISRRICKLSPLGNVKG